MLKALRVKFDQHQDLKQKLLSTGDAKLVEASPYDSYWGNATRKDGSKGLNKLGILLMKVRSELKKDQEEQMKVLKKVKNKWVLKKVKNQCV